MLNPTQLIRDPNLYMLTKGEGNLFAPSLKRPTVISGKRVIWHTMNK